MVERKTVEMILAATEPLQHPRAGRLPLYVWALRGAVPAASDDEMADILRALDARGIGWVATWETGEGQQQSLEDGLRVGRIQRDLGLPVAIDAIQPLYHFFNGDPDTAHVDAAGQRFFDDSFDPKTKMGCPFALAHRYAPIREQVEFFAEAYEQAGVPVSFIFSDWEIDGPLEWNRAWEHSRRCTRCQSEVPDINDFGSFQRALREIRADMQRSCYAEPILARFPQALVGNYAVYPHDGYRYWYDYFEEFIPELPHRFDQREPSRPWAREFEGTGYTFAMPVLYTWYRTFDWYDFANTDYRWFYNMLKVASNAGAHTPAETALITFVHHTLTSPPAKGAAPHVQPMSPEAYQELLWHALLRRHDAFFLWSPLDETEHEIRLLHPVWAAALEYREFLEQGTPMSFDVPTTPGPVVSGLRLGNRVLVRRSDFDDTKASVSLAVEGRTLEVPRAEGRCQILTLP